MGGYVSLAFAEKYPEMLLSLCLLHSHPLADPEEKKANRLADVDFVLAGGKGELVERAIPNLFAPQNLERFSNEVERVKLIARKIPDYGVIGALRGMANRKDRSFVIENAQLPVSFILGKYDKLIPLELFKGIQEANKKARFIILENSGHMGFVEETNQTAEAIRSVFI